MDKKIEYIEVEVPNLFCKDCCIKDEITEIAVKDYLNSFQKNISQEHPL